MSIEKMLSHVYEIEGLMLVTRRLGEENTPDVITNKIQRKVRELADMCGVKLTIEPAPAPAPLVAPVAEEKAEEKVDVVEETADDSHLPEDDYDADETWQHDNGEEFKEVFTLNYEEPKHAPVEPDEVPVADREPDEDISLEFIEADDDTPIEDESPAQEEPATEQEAPAVEQETVPAQPTPPAFNHTPTPPAFNHHTPTPPAFQPAAPEPVNDEPVPEPDPELVPEAEDEPDISVEFIEPEEETIPEPEDDMPLPPVPTDFPEVDDTTVVDPVDEQPLRIDEKLQRHLSKDIRKAISLNDRFRFQRELFAGSASAMNTAIEHIEMMNSYGNAELYFYSQLNWDRENETVQDFMAIVRNHFMTK